ncbi:hypothetical protein MMC17_004717 [Xylographa soralifera]|nr:hypothetical protein [Xylographa soralifera]
MSSSTLAGLENEPLGAPPPGVIPNFAHPETTAPELYVAAGICIPLILVFAVIRFYAKIAIMKKWTMDDLTFSFGMVAGLGYVSLNAVVASGSVFGVHGWDILYAELTATQLRMSLVFDSIYGPLIWFVKLSLFVLYVQIFRPLRWLRYWAYIGALATGLFYFSTMIAIIAICAPRDGTSQISYLVTLASPSCDQSKTPMLMILGVVSLVSDLYLVILPLPAVWTLHLPLRRKIAVSAMVFIGSGACIASAFGLVYRFRFYANRDLTWDFVPLAIVSDVEFTAGLLVCCMPTVAVAFKHFKIPMSNFLSSSRRGLKSYATLATSKHYELDSITNLQPAHINESKKSSRETTGNMQSPWSGPGQTINGITRWSPEYEIHSSSVLGGRQIRRTTDIDVTRDAYCPV